MSLFPRIETPVEAGLESVTRDSVEMFMHIDIDPKKVTRRHAPIPRIGSPFSPCPAPMRLSYKGVDFHMDVPFSDDVDVRFRQEAAFFHNMQIFLRARGVNATLETFE